MSEKDKINAIIDRRNAEYEKQKTDNLKLQDFEKQFSKLYKKLFKCLKIADSISGSIDANNPSIYTIKARWYSRMIDSLINQVEDDIYDIEGSLQE